MHMLAKKSHAEVAQLNSEKFMNFGLKSVSAQL